jgi:sRNA-binding protein
LDRSPYSHDLTTKQFDKYGNILFELSDEWLSAADVDDEIKAIYDRYAEESYDDMVEEQTANAKEAAANMFKKMFGVDIDADDIDLNDPSKSEKMFEKMAEAKEKMKADAEERERLKAERQANKKKSAKDIQKEEQRKLAESAISKTTKQIYMDLVKNFHPDAEQDEAKRAWKTEIMQKVTVAYGDNDYLKLVELQMTLLDNRDNAIGGFDDDQLKYFNNALKTQIDKLEYQMMMESPHQNPNLPYGHLFSPSRNVMLFNVDRHIKDCKKDVKMYENNAAYIADVKGFKDYIKRYQVDDGDDFDMNMLADMMKMMRYK